MESVARLVGQGDGVVELARDVEHDEGMDPRCRAGAVRPVLLAVGDRSVDPRVLEELPYQAAGGRGEVLVGAEHQL